MNEPKKIDPGQMAYQTVLIANAYRVLSSWAFAVGAFFAGQSWALGGYFMEAGKPSFWLALAFIGISYLMRERFKFLVNGALMNMVKPDGK